MAGDDRLARAAPQLCQQFAANRVDQRLIDAGSGTRQRSGSVIFT